MEVRGSMEAEPMEIREARSGIVESYSQKKIKSCVRDVMDVYIFGIGLATSSIYAKCKKLPMDTAILAAICSYIAGKIIARSMDKLTQCRSEHQHKWQFPLILTPMIKGINYIIGAFPAWGVARTFKNPLDLHEILSITGLCLAACVANSVFFLFVSAIISDCRKEPGWEEQSEIPGRSSRQIQNLEVKNQTLEIENQMAFSDFPPPSNPSEELNDAESTSAYVTKEIEVAAQEMYDEEIH